MEGKMFEKIKLRELTFPYQDEATGIKIHEDAVFEFLSGAGSDKVVREALHEDKSSGNFGRYKCTICRLWKSDKWGVYHCAETLADSNDWHHEDTV